MIYDFTLTLCNTPWLVEKALLVMESLDFTLGPQWKP